MLFLIACVQFILWTAALFLSFACRAHRAQAGWCLWSFLLWLCSGFFQSCTYQRLRLSSLFVWATFERRALLVLAKTNRVYTACLPCAFGSQKSQTLRTLWRWRCSWKGSPVSLDALARITASASQALLASWCHLAWLYLHILSISSPSLAWRPLPFPIWLLGDLHRCHLVSPEPWWIFLL